MWFIVAISVLVAAHEFGHFSWRAASASKSCGSRSASAGRCLSGAAVHPITFEYWLSMIPLGGYVKMLDEHEGPVVPRTATGRSTSARSGSASPCLLAGPAFNFLFAILAYWLMFVSGVQALKPMIARRRAGLGRRARRSSMPGDEIAAIGGEPTLDVGKRDAADSSTSCSATARIDLTVREPDG